MAQWLRELAASFENPGSVFINHRAGSQASVILFLGNLALSSSLFRHHTHRQCTDNTIIHIK